MPTSIYSLFSTYGCNGCHDNTFPPDFATQLTCYSTMVGAAGFDCGTAIVSPYSTANSELYVKLSAAGVTTCGSDRMPEGGPYLTNTELQTIADWINNGAPSGP
jgi:hypothetical protein